LNGRDFQVGVYLPLDDDELLHRASEKILKWKDAGTPPSLKEVQTLFDASIGARASTMARDKIIEAIIAAFGTELGGKRAMVSTWNQLAREFAAECAQEARENTACRSYRRRKRQHYGKRWLSVSELAPASDVDRVVNQVQTMGVVNERELVILIYVAATSRVLKINQHPDKGRQRWRQIIQHVACWNCLVLTS
jgi:hypothetical protein